MNDTCCYHSLWKDQKNQGKQAKKKRIELLLLVIVTSRLKEFSVILRSVL